MMKNRFRRLVICVLTGGVPLATVSCEANQISSFFNGVETILDEVEDHQEITFEEWISSELDD